MIFIKGFIERRVRRSVGKTSFRVTYFVRSEHDIFTVTHFTKDMGACLPASEKVIDIPVSLKVFGGKIDFTFEDITDTANDLDEEF